MVNTTVLRTIKVETDAAELTELKKHTALLCKRLRDILARENITAQVFVGGSFAKGTLAAGKNYDIDIFIRFSAEEQFLSTLLTKVIVSLKRMHPYSIEKVHGSRDYYRIISTEVSAMFELIPVLRISNPKQAQNVTDLSYFHVEYVRNALLKKKSLAREILLTKQFFKAQGVYGAESYIRGFSGYGVECLTIACGSLIKVLQIIDKANTTGEKIILDPAHLYPNKRVLMLEMNESKLQSPIVLVDPTFKERNVLAAVSDETFNVLANKARAFLLRPEASYFEEQKITRENLMQKAARLKAQLVEVGLSSDRQAGDIAGTKLRKAASFVAARVSTMSKIVSWHFDYGGTHDARVFFLLKPLRERIQRGPLESMDSAARSFREKHRENGIFVEKKRIYARLDVEENVLEGVKKELQNYKRVLEAMTIISHRVT